MASITDIVDAIEKELCDEALECLQELRDVLSGAGYRFLLEPHLERAEGVSEFAGRPTMDVIVETDEGHFTFFVGLLSWGRRAEPRPKETQ